MNVRLLHHVVGIPSAVRLAQYMGIPAAESFEHDKTRPDWIIRWGTLAKIPLLAKVGTLNRRAALAAQRNRVSHIETFHRAGIPAPGVWTKREGDTTPFSILGRTLHTGKGQTTRGYGITRYLPGALLGKHDFYAEFIPKIHEFRVDVIGHKTRVRQLFPVDPSSVAWNAEGAKFDTPSVPVPQGVPVMALAAVKALDLDFGAVDVVVAPDGRVFVLEVNTAPELTKPTLEWYAKGLAWMTGLNADSMPGWEGVKV